MDSIVFPKSIFFPIHTFWNLQYEKYIGQGVYCGLETNILHMGAAVLKLFAIDEDAHAAFKSSNLVYLRQFFN